MRTDVKGRAAIRPLNGTLTRLANSTEITLSSAHFSKDGSLHDASLAQKAGRTYTNVQHLVGGATFKVSGQSATATVRGTKFEVLIKSDGSMLVKLFEGQMDFVGVNTVHLTAPQQATADAAGNVGPAGPIVPEPGDPFGAEMSASDQTSQGTTPGTEQDYIGPPVHNGEQQQFTYSFAGDGLLKAALGYPGSVMTLQIKAPHAQLYSKTGASPILVVVNNALAGIYTIVVIGVSALGANGETPFVSVAALEPCASANIDSRGAVRRGLTSQDLAGGIQVSGVSNLNLTVVGTSLAGAVLKGTGTFDGAAWTGTGILLKHGQGLQVTAVGSPAFGEAGPPQQGLSHSAPLGRQDPSPHHTPFLPPPLFPSHHLRIHPTPPHSST